MPAVSIDALEHAKNLEASDDMLDPLPGVRQDTVVLALLVGQRGGARGFAGCERVRVIFPHALVPCITNQGRLKGQAHLGLTKSVRSCTEPQVETTHDHLRRHVDEDL